MKRSIILCLLFFFSLPVFSQSTYTHEIVAKRLVEYLPKMPGDWPVNPTYSDCFNYLAIVGISPNGGFIQGATMTVEESLELFSKVLQKNKSLQESLSQERAAQFRGKLTALDVKGVVECKPSENSDWQTVNKGAEIQADAIIRTGKEASVVLKVGALGLVVLDPMSRLLVSQMQVIREGSDEKIYLHLETGKLLVNVQGMPKTSELITSTPSLTAAVRGTLYELVSLEK